MTDESKQITIDDNGEITLPIVEILTGRGFITGKSGSGKSNTASVVVEELLDQGFPVLVVDTDGEYWGLKEEYEILHVGADEECDLQVGPEHAGKLAELALEENVPIILDVSGYLHSEDADQLVLETARELFAKEKTLNKPFLMLIEEVHEYIPQSGSLDEVGEMLVRIGKRGRKRGLGLVGMSQRPASVQKDFITQCDWLVWHRLTWDNDTDVAARHLGRDQANEIPDLNDGECFLQADFLDEDVLRVQVRRKHTFDAGATPDLGEFERPDLKSVGGDLVGELEEISDREAKRQDRIQELESRLEEKESRIEELEQELEQERQNSETIDRLADKLAMAAGGEEGGEALEEIREEKNQRITELESQTESLKDELREVREERDELRERVEELEEYEQAVEHMDELREGVRRMGDALGITVNGDDGRLRKRLEQKDERISSLESQVNRLREAGTELDPMEDYDEFLNAEPVRKEIEAAKESDRTSARYVKGVLASIIQEDGPVDYDTVAERLGLSGTQHVSKAASELESRKIITKDRRDDGMYVDLNVDGITEVRRAAAEREKAEELMEEL